MTTSSEFSRYHALLTDLADRALDAAAPRDTPACDLDPLLPVGKLLLRDDPTHHRALAASVRAMAALPANQPPADAAGHRREAYRWLALHVQLTAFRLRFESLPADVFAACESLLDTAVAPIREAEAWTDVPPPPPAVPTVLWQCLCATQFARLFSRDIDLELTDAVVHRIAQSPGRAGSLHAQQPDESLDAWTWRELVSLHALANLALLQRNRHWSSRVETIALHHLEHTQPDHVTTQPWALFAFLWSPRTRSFAEQQLHDAATTSDAKHRRDPVTALLLADAAAALWSFVEPIQSGP